jgi:hypothetical protein
MIKSNNSPRVGSHHFLERTKRNRGEIQSVEIHTIDDPAVSLVSELLYPRKHPQRFEHEFWLGNTNTYVWRGRTKPVATGRSECFLLTFSNESSNSKVTFVCVVLA